MQEEVKFDINPFILHENKVVLAKRSPDSLFGNHWHLPGGKVKVGERIIDALKRLAKMKTGYEIDLLYPSVLMERLIGIYDSPKRDKREHIVGMIFACSIIGGLRQPGKNITEVSLFYKDEISKLKLAFDHKKIIEDGFDLYSHYVE